MSDGREYPCAPGASHRDTETRRSHSDEPVGVIRTVGYPMTATTARSLSHNPVRLSVLLLPVMRLVFKTTDGVVEPGSTRADGSDVSVASTHRFRDGRIPCIRASCHVGVFPKFPADGRQGSKQSFGPVLSVGRPPARRAGPFGHPGAQF